MILPMLKVLVVGPKPLMPDVIGTIQRMGRVHLSATIGEKNGVSASQLTPSEAGQKQLVEKAAADIDGLLSLLGFRGAAAHAAPVSDWTGLAERLHGQQEQARAMIRQKLELEDELALIASYQSAFEILSPLMSRLEQGAKIKAFGFVMRGGDTSALEPLRRELKKMTAGRCEIYSHPLGDGRIAALVAYHVNDADKVRSVFAKLGVNELKLPSTVAGLPMPEAVKQLKQKLLDLPSQIRGLHDSIRGLSGQWGPELSGLRQQASDILSRLNVRAQIDESRFTFLLQGFLPENDLPRLRDALRSKYQDKVAVQILEIGHRESPQVPVILKNNLVVRPFELMLSIFNPPQYGTVDPTPFIAFFFPLYFGFIIGDIGYGLIMLAATLLLRYKFRKSDLARSLTTIFIICSLWTTLFGVVFGELFGDFGEHMGWVKPMAEQLNRMSSESIMTLFKLSVVIGFIQVYLGFGILLYTGIKHRNLQHILEPVAFALGILGVFGFAFTWMFHTLPAALMWPSIAVAGASAGALGILAGVAGPIEIFGNIGNILSYARLFAIGLSAAYLAYAANLIGRTIGGVTGFLVAALVVHPLFFALGLISPIMQPFRLQVVEFFTKFKYHDYPGKQYKPFKTTGGN